MMKTKSFRWNVTGISAILFYAVCGLLLLIWPNLALDIANYALAAVLCAVGVVLVISYLRGSAFEGAIGFNLAMGLVLILIGILLCVNNDVLKGLLPFLWGLAMLAGGFGKVQMAFDLKRMTDLRWWILLLGAAVSFVLGAISVTKPEFIAAVAVRFRGISLLVEAALDLCALIALKRRIKTAFPEAGKAE